MTIILFGLLYSEEKTYFVVLLYFAINTNTTLMCRIKASPMKGPMLAHLQQ